ncbi:MAG: large-conductance mechanosensitive channel protein MscL [Candidatus Aminicenantes bacterium]|nr:large-conductance mechanosensitive channel protein MscL [Candidatus Aminicenantes bacterium]
MFKEFREFALRGSVLDMAVGIIIGAAFGTIVTSLVADVLMPPIGLLLGKVDFANLYVLLTAGQTPGPYASLAAAQQAGAVTLNYGAFINKIISFLIIAFALFLMIRSMNRMKRKAEAPVPAATMKECPFCATAVPLKAVRCPHCTSELAK